MRSRVLGLVVVAWCAHATAQPARGSSAQPASSQSQFDAATQLEARGQFRAAADALEQLGHARPDDAFAPDALYEAAVVSEERLADPTRAQRLYAEVAARYPQSRLERRAKARADFLRAALTTGAAPLAEYEAIMNDAGAKDRAPQLARMEQLLAAHSDFALADRALYWLGNTYALARDDAHALVKLHELEQRFPSSEWALRAKKLHADLLLARGHVLAARGLYHELLAADDAIAHAAGREGLREAHTFLVRVAVSVVAALFLLGYLLVLLLRSRKTLRIAPFEAFYYLPVAALFVAAAATENRMIAQATTAIAIGGALIVWLSGASSKARLVRGPMAMRERWWRAALLLAAVLALVWLAIVTTGLTDIVLETFRSGPERG